MQDATSDVQGNVMHAVDDDVASQLAHAYTYILLVPASCVAAGRVIEPQALVWQTDVTIVYTTKGNKRTATLSHTLGQECEAASAHFNVQKHTKRCRRDWLCPLAASRQVVLQPKSARPHLHTETCLSLWVRFTGRCSQAKPNQAKQPHKEPRSLQNPSPHLHHAAQHDARGGRGQVVARAVQRGVRQERGRRLEADLQERRAAAVDAGAAARAVPALAPRCAWVSAQCQHTMTFQQSWPASLVALAANVASGTKQQRRALMLLLHQRTWPNCCMTQVALEATLSQNRTQRARPPGASCSRR